EEARPEAGSQSGEEERPQGLRAEEDDEAREEETIVIGGGARRDEGGGRGGSTRPPRWFYSRAANSDPPPPTFPHPARTPPRSSFQRCIRWGRRERCRNSCNLPRSER